MFNLVSAHTLITEVFRLQKLSNELCSTCTRLSSWSNKHMREYLLSAGEDISSLANDMAKVNKTAQNLYYPWEFDILFRYSDLWATGVNLPMCVNFGHVPKQAGFRWSKWRKFTFQDLKEWNGDPEKRTPLHRRAGAMMRLISSIEDLTTGPEFAYEYSRFTGAVWTKTQVI